MFNRIYSMRLNVKLQALVVIAIFISMSFLQVFQSLGTILLQMSEPYQLWQTKVHPLIL